MGFAMFIATAIFFIGNSDVFPAALRTVPILVALAVVVLTLGWLGYVLLAGPDRLRHTTAAGHAADR